MLLSASPKEDFCRSPKFPYQSHIKMYILYNTMLADSVISFKQEALVSVDLGSSVSC